MGICVLALDRIQLYTGTEGNGTCAGLTEDMVGQEIPLKFLEVDQTKNRLVVSNRRAVVETQMRDLRPGEVVTGEVRGIKPYGAFIDIGGVSGLLHISQISHDHISDVGTVLEVCSLSTFVCLF